MAKPAVIKMSRAAVVFQRMRKAVRMDAPRPFKKAWLHKTLCMAVAITLMCGVTGHTDAARPMRVTRTLVTYQPIPFDVTYIDVPEQYKGYTAPVSYGVIGNRRVDLQVLYEGDRPVRVVGIRSNDASRPVQAVIRRGTKELRTPTADGRRWQTSFINPLKKEGWLSADFYDYPHHNGVDFAAPYGTPVYASAGGKVALSGGFGEYGRCVIVDHTDGSQTLYAHNSSLLVTPGQVVKQGQQIARVGSTGNSTGNHLHFEIRAGGDFLDPLIHLEK